MIPVFDPSGGLLGYQSRKLSPKDTGPKYLTFKDKEKGVTRLYYRAMATLPTKTVVLVEDALSAEKVASSADAIALLTTTIDDVLKNSLIEAGYEHVCIWLDDDNTDVRRKQFDIQRLLDPYFKVRVIRTGKDPKRHSRSEIAEVLANA